jgi:uncharacterized protein (UPF0147 family)
MRGIRFLTQRLRAVRSIPNRSKQEVNMELALRDGEAAELVLNDEQPPARLVAGALAHLARHMETGCLRASSLAILLLEKVANDTQADAHLRKHARELVEVLEREDAETH